MFTANFKQKVPDLTRVDTSVCRGVGLELAVRAWLRGTPGIGRNGRSFRNCALSIHTAAMGQDYTRLAKYGVPDKVLASGVELASFLAEDKALMYLWQKVKRSAAAFHVTAVKCIESRFQISACPTFQQKGPGLVLTPRAPETRSGPTATTVANSEENTSSAHVASPVPLSSASLLPPQCLSNCKKDGCEGSGRETQNEDPEPQDLFARYDEKVMSSSAPLPAEHLSRKQCLSSSAPLPSQLSKISSHGHQVDHQGSGLKEDQEELPSNEETELNTTLKVISPPADSRKGSHRPTNGRRKVKRRPKKPAVWEEPAFLGTKQAHQPRIQDEETDDDQEMNRTEDQTKLRFPRRSRRLVANIGKRHQDDQHWQNWLHNDNCLKLDDFNEEGDDEAKNASPSGESGEVSKMMPSVYTARHTRHRTAVGNLDGIESLLQQNLQDSRNATSEVVQDFAELQRVFVEADVDSSGYIELREFSPLLAKLLKRQPISEEVLSYWKEIDRDGDEQITQDELQLWYCTKFKVESNPDFTAFFDCAEILTDHQRYLRDLANQFYMEETKIEDIYNEFKKWDSDNSGFIDYNEFGELMNKLLQVPEGIFIPENRLQKFFLEIDDNCSGKIELEEFVKWYAKYFMTAGVGDPIAQFYASLGTGWHDNWRKNQQKRETRSKVWTADSSRRNSIF